MEIRGRAWKLLDGRYRVRTRLIAGSDEYSRRQEAAEKAAIRKAGGSWDEESGAWIIPEAVVDEFKLERVFVAVVAGYCCRGPSRAEVRAYQLLRGSIFRVFCESCGKRPPVGTLWELTILESCGEGEEGQFTYEAAFRDGIEG